MNLWYTTYVTEYGSEMREWAYIGDGGKAVRLRAGLVWTLIDAAFVMGWYERNAIALREAQELAAGGEE